MEQNTNNLLTVDHLELNDLCDQIFAAFDSECVEQIDRCLDLFWARLAMHIRAEHLHLFPAILDKVKSRKEENQTVPSIETVRDTLTHLRKDHNFFIREILLAIKQMRNLRENDQNKRATVLCEVRERINGVTKRLENHNELEESDVYGWADALLQKEEHSTMMKKMQTELANFPPRFEQK